MVAEQPFVSTAVITNVCEAVEVAVPLNTPDALKLKPAGNVPEVTEYAYGLAPLLAVTV